MGHRAVACAAALSAAFFCAQAQGHGVRLLPDPPRSAARLDWLPALIAPARAAARMRVEESEGMRVFEADGLPDHATGRFPNRGNPNTIGAQRYELRVPLAPQKAARATPLVRSPFGIALNGVLFDPGTAEFWNDDPGSGWNYEALSGKLDLGLDQNNAHVQPNGAYHYHGLPAGLADRLGYRAKPALLGYAADGFPIYAPFSYANAARAEGALVELRSSYRVRQGTRPSGPGGRYDGTFVEDYEYVAGTGDLDECNGRQGVTPESPGGTYYYVVTGAFPFIPRCYAGLPHASFQRRGPGGPPPGRFGKGPPKGPPSLIPGSPRT